MSSILDPKTGPFAGRRIVITGAGSGIGATVARLLAAQDAKLSLFDLDGEKIGKLADELGAAAFAVDVADEAQVENSISRAAEAMNGIDGIVNGAGVNSKRALGDLSLREWQMVMGVNLQGPFLVCRAALPHLRAEHDAAIVNIVSGAALLPVSPRTSAYNASKGGLLAFSKSLALELAPDIRVNAVCPGAVDTPMLKEAMALAPEAISARYAMKRVGRPEEIAEAVLFLLGRQSSFITGTALAVDGGRSFH